MGTVAFQLFDSLCHTVNARFSLDFSLTQLSVRVYIRERHQSHPVQQQQQPDALAKDAQLPELYVRLSSTTNSHAAQ